ncbi:SHSP domain-containing protein [Meloidogyne graminicola]|uniref:SHSP domain-containing protein n=1 Tax=Meloidogyne graminicola TaxID=189291 RepID=A0A8S9ZR67_9BILA|nr:SHSP domain-containing protein [Meloidogyne graminicola]
MSTFNQSSSYNRTFERKVVEESVPRLLTSSPLHTIKAMSGFGSPGDLGLGSTSFVQPHNYHFGTATSGSFQLSDDYLSVSMDVSSFAPEDLKVYFLINERHFIRKFTLPRNAHPDLVQSNLTSDGHLTITASAPKMKETSPGRTIPIKIVNTNTSGSFVQQPSTCRNLIKNQ